MARPQAHQTDKLVTAGLEGFALVDDLYGRRKKPARVPTTQEYDHHEHRNKQQQYVYWGPQIITVTEPVIDSNQAAQFYGGVAVVEYSTRKHIPMAC